LSGATDLGQSISNPSPSPSENNYLPHLAKHLYATFQTHFDIDYHQLRFSPPLPYMHARESGVEAAQTPPVNWRRGIFSLHLSPKDAPPFATSLDNKLFFKDAAYFP